MKKILLLPLLTGVLILPVSAQNSPSLPTSPEDAMAAAVELLKAFQGDTNSPFSAMGGKPAVDFRELKELLPAQIADLPRTEAGGKKTGAFGAHISTAEGKYGSADGPELNLKITDLCAMGPLGAMAGLGWMSAEIDSEGDAGYERTVDYNGNKALEKYSAKTKSGTVTIMVGGRFLVEIEGVNIVAAQLKAAAAAIDYSALDQLAIRPHDE
jgi:hypothetical protein